MENHQVSEEGNKWSLIKRIGCTAAICFGIVVILVAIALPNFLKSSGKAPQSECKSNLGAIYTAQVAYFGEYNTYPGRGIISGKQMNAFQMVNWEPSGQNRYRYIMDTGDIHAKTGKNKCDIAQHISSSKDGFTACCTSNIDRDDFCDVWCINDDKVLKNQMFTEDSYGEDGNDVNN